MPFIKSDTEHEDPMNCHSGDYREWRLCENARCNYECRNVGQAKIETSMTRSKVKMEA